jgi:hypothetical protein
MTKNIPLDVDDDNDEVWLYYSYQGFKKPAIFYDFDFSFSFKMVWRVTSIRYEALCDITPQQPTYLQSNKVDYDKKKKKGWE